MGDRLTYVNLPKRLAALQQSRNFGGEKVRAAIFVARDLLGGARFAIAVYFRSPNFPIRRHPCDLLCSGRKIYRVNEIDATAPIRFSTGIGEDR
jgi:hypothetical protein